MKLQLMREEHELLLQQQTLKFKFMQEKNTIEKEVFRSTLKKLMLKICTILFNNLYKNIVKQNLFSTKKCIY